MAPRRPRVGTVDAIFAEIDAIAAEAPKTFTHVDNPMRVRVATAPRSNRFATNKISYGYF